MLVGLILFASVVALRCPESQYWIWKCRDKKKNNSSVSRRPPNFSLPLQFYPLAGDSPPSILDNIGANNYIIRAKILPAAWYRTISATASGTPSPAPSLFRDPPCSRLGRVATCKGLGRMRAVAPTARLN
jgi:hypothetical protein